MTDELSIADAAILLGRSVAQIRPLCYNGTLGPIRKGGTPLQVHYFVTRAGVLAYQRRLAEKAGNSGK